MSHELNTPLSVIQLEARGLRDGLQSPERASDHIIQEVDRLARSGDRPELAGGDRSRRVPAVLRVTVQIYELIEEEVERWQPQSQARQVELSLEASGGLPEAGVDRMRMSQALGNVIGNALHCTGAGGKGHRIEGSPEWRGVAVSISQSTDDGIGIDAADLPHVFDRFYRTGQSRSLGISGTGLGLSITRAIVEAHGGSIAVASDGLGQGATVTIRLPTNE